MSQAPQFLIGDLFCCRDTGIASLREMVSDQPDIVLHILPQLTASLVHGKLNATNDNQVYAEVIRCLFFNRAPQPWMPYIISVSVHPSIHPQISKGRSMSKLLELPRFVCALTIMDRCALACILGPVIMDHEALSLTLKFLWRLLCSGYSATVSRFGMHTAYQE